jgi:hypothetical protein
MERHMSQRWRRLGRLVGGLGVVVAPSLHAQVITGIAAYNTTATGDIFGGWRTNTQGGDFLSNTYITRGTSPTTDAFIYNGNANGQLLGSGITLTAGVNTFYLWGFTSYGSANWGVSLMTGANTAASLPTLSSWYSASANTLSAVGRTAGNDFINVSGGPLSALIDGFTVTITEFSYALVSRNVFINSYSVSEAPSPVSQGTAKLVLTVTGGPNPNPSVVPEPSTYALMGTGLLGLAVLTRRRQRA